MLNISSQYSLFSICTDFVSELTDHKIKIPTEMMQNLMILHSYILVKVCPLNVFACTRPAGLLRTRKKIIFSKVKEKPGSSVCSQGITKLETQWKLKSQSLATNLIFII